VGKQCCPLREGLLVAQTPFAPPGLQALKDSLVMSLSLMPPEALVGVITYGAHVCRLQALHSYRSAVYRSFLLNGVRPASLICIASCALVSVGLSFTKDSS
jgi:hypothetical protein